MFTEAERLRAIELYFKYVRKLGLPQLGGRKSIKISNKQ